MISRLLLITALFFSNPSFAETTTYSLELKPGLTVQAQLKRTGPHSKGPLPVFLIFGGFEEAGKVLELLNPQVPSILASFDYPFQGHRRFVFPDSLGQISDFKASIDLTLVAIDRLVEKLRTLSFVDQDRIAIVGASFGAPFAIRGAARNPHLTTIIVVHGFADVPKAIEHRLNQLWSNRLGSFTPFAAWAVSRAARIYLDPPEPMIDGPKLQAHQKVLVVEAIEDRFIPADSRLKLLKALQSSSAQVTHLPMPGDHLQPGSEKLIEEIMAHALDWLKRR